MSKKLKALLENFGVENVDEVLTALMDDETDNQEVLDSILTGAQKYARPFIEAELNTTFGEERKSHKGKYMKEAVLLANKEFGSVLTNSEIEKILSDPANKDKTINAVFKVLKEKAVNKGGADTSEFESMLNLANEKIAELEAERDSIETKFKTKYESDINAYKIDGVLSKELVRVLDGKTSISASKAASILKEFIGKKALLKLQGDDKIALYNKDNENEPLKKSQTQVYDFDSYILDNANELELIQKSNGGERFNDKGSKPDGNEPKQLTGLAAKMAAITE
jgi:hypothetical protein